MRVDFEATFQRIADLAVKRAKQTPVQPVVPNTYTNEQQILALLADRKPHRVKELCDTLRVDVSYQISVMAAKWLVVVKRRGKALTNRERNQRWLARNRGESVEQIKWKSVRLP